MITPNATEYVLVRGRMGTLPQMVTDRLKNGWQLLGQPFRTGNRTKFKPEGSNCYLPTNEIAQAMIRTLAVADEDVPPIVVELDDDNVKDKPKQRFTYQRPMFRRVHWSRRGRTQS